jgi:hypothetical protein
MVGIRGDGRRFCREVSPPLRRAGIAYVFEYHHYVVLLLIGDDRAIRGRKAGQKMRGVGAPTYAKCLLSFSVQPTGFGFSISFPGPAGYADPGGGRPAKRSPATGINRSRSGGGHGPGDTGNIIDIITEIPTVNKIACRLLAC